MAGYQHQGFRSGVTCYRILLTTAAPLVLWAARGRPTSSEGRRPRTPPRGGTCRGTPRALPPTASGGGLPNLGGRTRAVTKTRGGLSPRPPAHSAPAGMGPAGRPRTAAAGPARSPPVGRAGGARACPTALFLIRAELASEPCPPARPPRPGGRPPNVSRPAHPTPQSPEGRTLRGAFPALQPLPAPATPTLVRAPLPAAARKQRPRSGSPLPLPSPFCACAPRGPGSERGAPRLSLPGSNGAPSNRSSC